MAARSRLLDRMDFVLFWGLIVMIAWAPLPLASNRLWSWSLLGIGAALLVALWALVRALDPGRFPPWRSALTVPAILYAFVAAVVVLQATCLPVAEWGHPVWRLVAEDTCASISVERNMTWTALGRLLTYGATFWIALQVGASSQRAKQLLAMITFSIAAYAAYGLVIHFLGIKPTLFFETWEDSGYVTSTFVNRNSFAAFAGMGLMASVGRLLDRTIDATGDGRTKPMRAASMAAAELYPYVLAAVLCLAAVVLTASRAGMAATMAGLIVLSAATCLHHRAHWKWWAASSAVVVLMSIFVVVGGGGRLIERVERADEDFGSRQVVIGQTLRGSLEHPWLGVGFGTFEDAWPAYRPAGADLWFRRAHSTYAENLLELGFPAMLALTVSVGWILAVCARGLVRRRRNGIYPIVAFAAVSVPVLHSTIDFSLQMPALAFVVSALLGLGFIQSFSSRQQTPQDQPGKATR